MSSGDTFCQNEDADLGRPLGFDYRRVRETENVSARIYQVRPAARGISAERSTFTRGDIVPIGA